MKIVIITFLSLISLTLFAQRKQLNLDLNNSPNKGKTVTLTYQFADFSNIDLAISGQFTSDFYKNSFNSLVVGNELRKTKSQQFTDESIGLGMTAKYIFEQLIPGVYFNSSFFINSHKVLYWSDELDLATLNVERFNTQERVFDIYGNLEFGYQFVFSNITLNTGWVWGNGLYIDNFLNEIPSKTSSFRFGIGFKI